MHFVLIALFALVTIQMFFRFSITLHTIFVIMCFCPQSSLGHYSVLPPSVCSGCNSQNPPLDGKIIFLLVLGFSNCCFLKYVDYSHSSLLQHWLGMVFVASLWLIRVPPPLLASFLCSKNTNLLSSLRLYQYSLYQWLSPSYPLLTLALN